MLRCRFRSVKSSTISTKVHAHRCRHVKKYTDHELKEKIKSPKYVVWYCKQHDWEYKKMSIIFNAQCHKSHVNDPHPPYHHLVQYVSTCDRKHVEKIYDMMQQHHHTFTLNLAVYKMIFQEFLDTIEEGELFRLPGPGNKCCGVWDGKKDTCECGRRNVWWDEMGTYDSLRWKPAHCKNYNYKRMSICERSSDSE